MFLDMPNQPVAKSFVPSQGGWVKATKVNRNSLRAAARHKRYTSGIGKPAQTPLSRYRADFDQSPEKVEGRLRSQIARSIPGSSKKTRYVDIKHGSTSLASAGVVGGKSKPNFVVHGSKTSARDRGEAAAQARPRRSAYRLYNQIATNPQKLQGEIMRQRMEGGQLATKFKREVSKTFIPGKGYVPASKIVRQGGKAKLRKIVTEQKDDIERVAGDERYHFQQYKDDQTQINAMMDKLKKGKSVKSPVKGVMYQRPDLTTKVGMKIGGAEAFAVSRGGRRGQKMMVVPRGANPDTVKHEVAHLTPKRSSYRMWQTGQSPTKLMAEEARADMATRHPAGYYGSTFKNEQSGYVQAARSEKARKMQEDRELQVQLMSGDFSGRSRKWTTEAMDSYRQTQDKILRARSKGGKNPYRGKYVTTRFHGNKYVDSEKRRRPYVKIGAATVGGTGVGVYGFKRYQREKKK